MLNWEGVNRFSPPVVFFVALVDFFLRSMYAVDLTIGHSLSKIYQSAVCPPHTSLTRRIVGYSVVLIGTVPCLVSCVIGFPEQSIY